jgi:hypothetical protein
MNQETGFLMTTGPIDSFSNTMEYYLRFADHFGSLADAGNPVSIRDERLLSMKYDEQGDSTIAYTGVPVCVEPTSQGG